MICQLSWSRYRGFYMSARVIFNLLNEFGQNDKMRGFVEILSFFPNDFNKFKNTWARVQDSIYNMTLKSYFISDFCTKKRQHFAIEKRDVYCRRQCITLRSHLHILSTSGLSFLMHDVITLSDASSYDKHVLMWWKQDPYTGTDW